MTKNRKINTHRILSLLLSLVFMLSLLPTTALAAETVPTLTAGTAERTSDTTATVTFTSNEAGTYYYAVVESGATAPDIDMTAGFTCVAGLNTITLTGLTAGAKDIYIVAKDATDNTSSALKMQIPAKPILTNITVVRIGGGEAYVSFDTTFDSTLGKYYYVFAESGAPAPTIDTSGEGTNSLWNNNLSSGNHGTILVSGVPDTACDLYLVVKDNVSGITYQPIKIEISAKTNNTPFKTSEHRISGFADNNNTIAVTASSPAAFAGETPTPTPLTEVPGVAQPEDNVYVFAPGAKIALYGWDGGTAYSDKVTLTHTGNAWINDKELYWGSGAHSFVGLVPESLTLHATSVSGGSDYLVANWQGTPSGDLSLQFKHIMSRLDVNLKFSAAYDASKITNVAVKTTLKTSGTYALDSGITATGDAQTITFAKTYYAVPQTVNGLQLTIYFTYDGQPMSCTATIDGSCVLASGDRTTVNVAVGWPESFPGLIITGGTENTDYTYENGVLDIKNAGTYEIKNADPTTATGDIIRVSAPEGAVNITLSGLNIDVSGTGNATVGTDGLCAFDITSNCTTNITLKDGSSNTLKSGAHMAGLQNRTYSLTISCEHAGENGHECGSGCGAIEVQGGQTAAGIGGRGGEDSDRTGGSNITINGGHITATALSGGAGIGGGSTKNGANIVITGGIVTATGGGAGIGGGNDRGGDGSNITISGGTVTATSEEGAGIGGDDQNIANNIKIIPAANTKIYAYNGSDNTGTQLFGSPFTGETDITYQIRNEKAFFSVAEHVHSYSTDWSYDADYHWHAADCGHDLVSDKNAHIYDNAEDIDCNVCGYTRSVAPSHTHTLGYQYDANSHWQVCADPTCPDSEDSKTAADAHSYGGDRTCDICGYTRPAPQSAPSGPSWRPDVDCGKNGDVTVSPRYPEQGDRVTITTDPDKGYEVDEVIVTDRRGNEVRVTDNGDGTYSFRQPYGKVEITVTFKQKVCGGGRSCPISSFADLTPGAWYHDGVHYCVEQGLMQGIGGGRFDPNGTTSRAMIWTILARLEGVDTDGEVWYEAGQQWAMENGISDGTMPDAPITREQLATILWRYSQHKGYDVSVGENTNILSYEDAFDISEYAIPAMQWACGAGVMDGIEKNERMYLDPQGSATRAQTAALLMRFCEN